ncbi:MAG: glycoside hydrolase family 28 protein, partial [Lachnospiraceae bacterium]|nr:glycoside hydrolase family 28 protein [Lachnospiraceae bacterium]
MDYRITDYGAVPDGVSKCTAAIQAAIDACTVTGGRVVVPAGRYLSGSLCLKSNVNLYLESGAVLISSLDPEDVIDFMKDFDDDNRDSGWEGGCFLFARHGENITISGQGMIDGQGRKVFFDDNADNGYHECPLLVTGFRPRMSFLEDIKNLTVTGVTFYDSAFWTLHMAGCQNVLVEGIRILNNDRGPNNDGIDPDCCKNVVVRGCTIETGDDSIVVKATGPMFRKYGDCENVVIQGCVMHSRDSALKIGTETHGSIRNVILSDCVVKDCSRALSIWSRDGGTISDIYFHHVVGNTRRYADCPQRVECAPRWWGKGEPIFISATKRKDVDRIPGKISNICMDHLRITAESSIFIAGEEYSAIENIRLEQMDITWKKQSVHTPDVFDEQPSERDVYEHEIPCIYMRSVKNAEIQGHLEVDSSLKETIQKRDILEQCQDVKLN